MRPEDVAAKEAEAILRSLAFVTWPPQDDTASVADVRARVDEQMARFRWLRRAFGVRSSREHLLSAVQAMEPPAPAANPGCVDGYVGCTCTHGHTQRHECSWCDGDGCEARVRRWNDQSDAADIATELRGMAKEDATTRAA